MKDILRYFSPDIKSRLEVIIGNTRNNIHEIRLRCGKPLSVMSYGKIKYISERGGFTDIISDTYKVSRRDIEYTFQSVCDYSVHSYENEIANSFITVRGGHRVGLAGSAVISNGKVSAVKHISSVNFRIASQIDGCSDRIIREIFDRELSSVLVCGSPSSGKTTILKDLCRQLSEKYCVSVIDERGEIGAVFRGECFNNLGSMCDIFDGYPKAYGIETALRVMSPEIIVCDEIGGEDEVRQLLSCVNSGVKIIASAHSGSYEELLRRKNIKMLLDSHIFDYAVFLKDRRNPSETEKIVRLNSYDNKTSWDSYDNNSLSSYGYCNILRNVQAYKESSDSDKSC